MFVVINESAQVLVANHTGSRLIAENDWIAIDSRGRFIAANSSVNASIRDGIAEVVRTAHHAGQTARRLVAVHCRESNAPCLLEISPLHDACAEFDGSLRGALISVVDPELRESIQLRGLDVAYSLTEAEMAVASLLVDGMFSTEIAEARGVRPATIKSQVATLLSKTGSRNRTELVRRALMLNLPIDF